MGAGRPPTRGGRAAHNFFGEIEDLFACHRLVHEAGNIEFRLFLLTQGELGLDGGEFGQKDGAAVLIRENGRLVSADLARDRDDLVLVEADEGTKDGERDDGVRGGDALDGLACDLTQTFARDEALSADIFCVTLRKAVHETAQKGDVEFGRALCVDLFLDVRNVERYKAGGVGEAGKFAGELLDFLLCAVVGIGVAVEMEKFDAHAALCHHIARDGRVDAARDEEHALP